MSSNDNGQEGISKNEMKLDYSDDSSTPCCTIVESECLSRHPITNIVRSYAGFIYYLRGLA